MLYSAALQCWLYHCIWVSGRTRLRSDLLDDWKAFGRGAPRGNPSARTQLFCWMHCKSLLTYTTGHAALVPLHDQWQESKQSRQLLTLELFMSKLVCCTRDIFAVAAPRAWNHLPDSLHKFLFLTNLTGSPVSCKGLSSCGRVPTRGPSSICSLFHASSSLSSVIRWGHEGWGVPGLVASYDIWPGNGVGLF